VTDAGSNPAGTCCSPDAGAAGVAGAAGATGDAGDAGSAGDGAADTVPGTDGLETREVALGVAEGEFWTPEGWPLEQALVTRPTQASKAAAAAADRDVTAILP